MSIKVSLSPYKINSKDWNASSSSPEGRDGALVRLDYPWGSGFADYCPWGNSSSEIFDHIEALSGQFRTQQLSQTLLFSLIDSLYRFAKVSMFSAVKVPKSHKTLNEWLELPLESFLQDYQLGFRSFKLKVGRDEVAEYQKLMRLIDQLPPDVRFRLDFNSLCKKIHCWSEVLSRGKVELVEDPVDYENGVWQQIQSVWEVPLAADKSSESEWSGILVYKPAVCGFLPKFLLSKCFVTSFMDHPVGQTFAAWSAGIIQSNNPELLTCGLLTHEIVDIPGWLESIRSPDFPLPGGTGIGFNDQLQTCKWESACELTGIDPKQLFSQIPGFIQKRIEIDLKDQLPDWT